ncbi:hypothetical protein [Nonomuraea typhae]|uniref:hypothetical protein n=1 Tax=Nonomuraea typhae TaxID=2603600 RepID=UPI0012F9F920|nr:hypothetical protein [Nonomuraea typhae]
MLLVLDTCERLIHAVRNLASFLLAAAPRLQILATGRDPLGLDGEHLAHVEQPLVWEGQLPGPSRIT